MKKFLAVLVVVLATGGFLAFHSSASSTHTITGSILLTDSKAYDESDVCNENSGYSDLSDGAQATVTDENGKILGTATVETGVGTTTKNYSESSSYSTVYSGVCLHKFTIENVANAKFYTVTVGHRKAPAHSMADMKKESWTVGLSIGS